MKKHVLSIVLLLSVANLQAQRISLHTSGAASVGETLAVSGDTFTGCQGVWIYTWDNMGKKINTRATKL